MYRERAAEQFAGRAIAYLQKPVSGEALRNALKIRVFVERPVKNLLLGDDESAARILGIYR